MKRPATGLKSLPASPTPTAAAAIWRAMLLPGVYRLIFDTGAYLRALGRASIYPEISITSLAMAMRTITCRLLLSDNGYTTYRGS